MAIVFISPKRGQRMLVGSAFIFLAVILVAASIFILLPEIKNQITIIPDKGAYTAPDISINFDLMDSEKVKNLQPFNPPTDQGLPGRTDPFVSY